MLDFVVQSTVLLFLSYSVYRLLLKKEKAFYFNRVYLLLTIIFSICFSAIEFENEQISKIIGDSTLIQTTQETTLKNDFNNETGETIFISNQDDSSNAIVIYSIYGVISLLLSFRFSKNLWSLIKLIINNTVIKGKVNLVLLDQSITPFSFFNYIFLNQQQYDKGLISKDILIHESIHCQQLHSVDNLLTEFLLIFLWFNPFLWLYKNEISENHEYLADDGVLKQGIDIKNYSTRIIDTLSLNQQALSCGFSFIQTKNRIKMINRRKSPTIKVIIKTITAGIVITICLLVSSFKYSENKKPYVVVIDPGHGGTDSGISNDKMNEKDITLDVCKRIVELNIENEIKILLTRENDQDMGIAERISLINSIEPDLFISLHVNFHENDVMSGPEILLLKKDSINKSSSFASVILSQNIIKNDPNTHVKTKQADFALLKQTQEHPGFFLELGYISNRSDVEKFKNEDAMQTFASSIYESLIQLKEFRETER